MPRCLARIWPARTASFSSPLSSAVRSSLRLQELVAGLKEARAELPSLVALEAKRGSFANTIGAELAYRENQTP